MIVVSGCRRSGTSMLMYALKEAGLKVVGNDFFVEDLKTKTEDGKASPKLQKMREMTLEGNPNGYWEVMDTTAKTGLVKEYDGDVIKIMFEALPKSHINKIDKVLAIFREPRDVMTSVLKYYPVKTDLYIIKILLDIMDCLIFMSYVPHKIVFYEDIVKNPDIMKEICEFTGGNWEKARATIDPNLKRSEPTKERYANIDLWEKLYKLIKNGKIEEALSYKNHIENYAKNLL